MTDMTDISALDRPTLEWVLEKVQNLLLNSGGEENKALQILSYILVACLMNPNEYKSR